MAISLNGGYHYKRRNGDFPAAWAAMTPYSISQSASRSIAVTVPTAYKFSGEVYAGKLRNTFLPTTFARLGNSGSLTSCYCSVTDNVQTTTTAHNSPFIICVTYDTFANMPKTDIATWRELGVNGNSSGDMYGYTNRVIIPDAMANYIYITGLYVLDNSDDGNYSATNPRTVLNGYDIFTPVTVTQFTVYSRGNSTGTLTGGTYLIPLSAYMMPYYHGNQGYLGFSGGAGFNVMPPTMQTLGNPISKMVQIVGLASNGVTTKCRATLYPTVSDLQKDLYAWGVPFTFDIDAAYYNNVDDLPDNVVQGQTDNPSGGGDGDGDNFSDPIDFPSAPYSPASLGGYLTLVQSPSELAGLTTVLWKPVIRDLSDALKVYFNTDNLTNSVLSIMYYPLDLAAMSLGLKHSDNIRIAWSTDNISADIMANNVSHEIDAGYYDVTEYYGSFLDYSPYTTIDIWLPYIGYKPLDIDAIMGKTIRVKYFVDFVDGLATAVIFADDQPINNYTGQLGIDLAVTGRDNAAKVRQTIDSVMTAVTGVNKAVGGVTQGAAQAYAGNVGGSVNALSGVTSTLTNVGMTGLQTAVQQPQTVIYGTAGGENWLSMPQKCHLKITRTVAASPASYINEMGYPTTYTNTVSKFTGYLKCAAVFGDFTGIPADDADEIQSLLNSGIHISGGAFE